MVRSDLQRGAIIHIPLVFKRFLNSAQHTFWVPPKGPELLSFTKCNKNQWKHSKTFNCWPSKWRTYQYSSGFRLFLKLARSMISIPSKASKMTNLYGSQNALKTNEMLQKLTNMKSKHGETLNIPHVLYCFSNSDKSRFGSLPSHPGTSNFCGLWQSLKHCKTNGFGPNLLSWSASLEPSYWFSIGF